MNTPTIELLANPFCMADRDVETVKRICNKYNASLQVYNLWDIDDEELDDIPLPIASLIREWRSGKRPGSIYSTVFVNGERITLDPWKGHLNTFSEAIEKSFKRNIL